MATQKPYDCYTTKRKQTSRAYKKDDKNRIETTTEITRDCAYVVITDEALTPEEETENTETGETDNEKLFSKLVEHFTK